MNLRSEKIEIREGVFRKGYVGQKIQTRKRDWLCARGHGFSYTKGALSSRFPLPNESKSREGEDTTLLPTSLKGAFPPKKSWRSIVENAGLNWAEKRPLGFCGKRLRGRGKELRPLIELGAEGVDKRLSEGELFDNDAPANEPPSSYAYAVGAAWAG